MCGVVGVRVHEGARASASEYAVNLILRLQHRGQDAAGVSVLDANQEFQSVKGFGLIQSALSDWKTLPESRAAIAHTRYATTGKGGVAEIQPFIEGVPVIALAHNGNIVNDRELAQKYQIEKKSTSDLEIIQQLLLKSFASGASWSDAFDAAFEELTGSYAVVGLDQKGHMFAFRDPHGLRPLFIARNKEITVLSSETASLSIWSDLEVEEIPPGAWVIVDDKGQVTKGSYKKQNLETEKFCMFEMVYFASPQSEFKNKSVYRYRFQLGLQLAREIKESMGFKRPEESFDYIVPVPETSRTAAIAIAEELDIPYREFLVKNAYVSRTFILSSQDQRKKALKAKLSLVGPEIKGKKILLVDDSVVRGNTSQLMAERLREVGAETVSLASTCPPIRYGCFYGIDFPDQEELIAHNCDERKICQKIGVQNLFYISQAGLKKALESEKLCTACLDGEYPTGQESFSKFLELRRHERLG